MAAQQGLILGEAVRANGVFVRLAGYGRAAAAGDGLVNWRNAACARRPVRPDG